LKETPTPSHLDFLCNFVAICLPFAQLILQLKLCLYTTVHLLLDKFKNFSQVSLITQSLCDTRSPRVGVSFWAWSQGPTFLLPDSETESGVLNFLTLESESESHKKTRTPNPCTQLPLRYIFSAHPLFISHLHSVGKCSQLSINQSINLFAQ